MSKERRKKELQNEMEKLQKRLESLQDEYEDEQSDDEEDEDFMKDFDPHKKRRVMPPKPPRPAMPPMPPLPPHPRINANPRIHIERRELNDEEKKAIQKEKARILEEKARISQEISRMKEELYSRRENYSEIRRDLRQKEEEIRRKERELRARALPDSSYSWDNDLDNDIEVVTRDLELRLGDYTRSILASVAESLKASMGVAVQGAGEIGENIKIVGEELGKIGKDIGEKISKDIVVNIGPQIPEEKLEEFYEIGANIVGAIGDPNRLRILKELEKGPKYQKELSDITNLRGGTFKHHMDKLLEEDVNFVTQEVVRGRYFLTTRGREALKLAEMQYMRYLEEKSTGGTKKKITLDIDDEEDEYNVDIK